MAVTFSDPTHPFINMGHEFWSQTTDPNDGARAIALGPGAIISTTKATSYFVMRVRGGNGYGTGAW